MVRFPRPVTTRRSVSPDRTASSTTYWMEGLSRRGSISLGWALVAGRNLVPGPSAGMTGLLTFADVLANSRRVPEWTPATRFARGPGGTGPEASPPERDDGRAQRSRERMDR